MSDKPKSVPEGYVHINEEAGTVTLVGMPEGNGSIRRWKDDEFFNIDHKANPHDVITAVNALLDAHNIPVKFHPVDCGDDNFYFGLEKFDWDQPTVDVTKLPADFRADMIESYSDGFYKDLSEEERIKIVQTHNLTAVTPRNVLREWCHYIGIINYTEKFIRLFNAVQTLKEPK